MNFNGFKKVFLLAGLIFAFSFIFPKQVLADTCSNCLQLNSSNPAVCFNPPNGPCIAAFPNCPTYNWSSDDMSECQANIGNPQPSVCTGLSGANSPCGYLGPWSYCYVSGCESKARLDELGSCYYQYRYTYTSCSAYDTCESGPYLKAGRCGEGTACDSSGCKVGGTYKTCCQVSGGQFTGNLGGNCTGGCRTGTCPSGSSAVICGVTADVCAAVAPYPCTTAACGQSACQAVKPVTPAPTSAPAPTSPPPSGCRTTVCREGYWYFQSSTESRFNIKVDSSSHQSGDTVVVTVGQWPGGGGQCQCKYQDINVVMNNPGGTIFVPDYKICTLHGYNIGTCPYELSCNWNTSSIPADALVSGAQSWAGKPYPAGTYVLSAYYGGHGPGDCCDSAKTCSVNVVLTAPATPTPTPAPPPAPSGLSGSCSASGNSATVSWNAVSGATKYALRVDDKADGWFGTKYGANCPSPNGYGDFCLDLTATSYTFSTVPGRSYNWWVHAIKDNLWSPAADGPDFTCPVPPTCSSATKPVLSVLNNRTYENAIDFSWTTRGNAEIEYQRFGGNQCKGNPLPCLNCCPVASPPRTEIVQTNDSDKWICVRVRGKNYGPNGSCQNCSSNNPPACCVSDWSNEKQCAFCKHPTNVTMTKITCTQGNQTWNGTRISWTDNSNVEDGFVIYRCPKGSSCPANARDYFATVGKNITSYDDCTYGFPYESYTYAVRCYTTDCGPIPPPVTPTPPGPTPTSRPSTPTPIRTPTPTPVPVGLCTCSGCEVVASNPTEGTNQYTLPNTYPPPPDNNTERNGQYAKFTPSKNYSLRQIILRMGNSGGMNRNFECKITKDDTNLTPVGSPFPTKQVDRLSNPAWYTVNYGSTSYPQLNNNTSYRLYCRNATDTINLYWTRYGAALLKNYYVCGVPITPTPTPTSTPTPTPIPAWFQTQEGDVHANGSNNSRGKILSKIPATANPRYFSLKGENSHGLVSWGGGSIHSPNFGSGQVSEDPQWLANSKAKKRNYEFFYALLDYPQLTGSPLPGQTEIEISNSTLNDLVRNKNGIGAYEVNIKTSEHLQVKVNQKIILLTTGKFLAKNKISIEEGGSLVVIAKEGIGVSKNLGGGTDEYHLGGLFITDGIFYSSVDEDFYFTKSSSNRKLIIKGGVVADDFELTRDLGSTNSTTPAEKFIYSPGMFLNFHSSLWLRYHIWEEVAP